MRGSAARFPNPKTNHQTYRVAFVKKKIRLKNSPDKTLENEVSKIKMKINTPTMGVKSLEGLSGSNVTPYQVLQSTKRGELMSKHLEFSRNL